MNTCCQVGNGKNKTNKKMNFIHAKEANSLRNEVIFKRCKNILEEIEKLIIEACKKVKIRLSMRPNLKIIEKLKNFSYLKVTKSI